MKQEPTAVVSVEILFWVPLSLALSRKGRGDA